MMIKNLVQEFADVFMDATKNTKSEFCRVENVI